MLLIAVATALPAVVVSMLLLWHADPADRTRWTAVAFIGIGLAIGLSALHERVIRPLQTLANVLAALREGDYSLRVRGANARDDSLGLVYLEANVLADTLRRQRLGALEASTLLRAVMAEIDSAIFAFDDAGVLRLVNRRAEQLLGAPSERLLGRTAATLGLEPCLAGDSPRVLDPRLLASGRWEMRRSDFRQDGRIHQLVVLTNLSRTLQVEKRQAWERLIRVLSHEINNSLAPIRSLAGSLKQLLTSSPGRPMGKPTCARGGTSSVSGPRRWAGSCPRTRGWRGCPGRFGRRSRWQSGWSAWPHSKPGFRSGSTPGLR